MTQERRQNKRFAIDQFIEISFTKEKFISAKGINISKGGLLCELNDPVELSSRAFVMITLEQNDGDYQFSCEGIITRCEKIKNSFQAAIQFTDLSDEDKNKLKKFLK